MFSLQQGKLLIFTLICLSVTHTSNMLSSKMLDLIKSHEDQTNYLIEVSTMESYVHMEALIGQSSNQVLS